MGNSRAPGVEDIRYTNPITGDISPTSMYLNEQGIKKNNKPEYKINGGWVKAGDVPHKRGSHKKWDNSKNGYFCKKLNKMNWKGKERRKQGKFISKKYIKSSKIWMLRRFNKFF